jgi:prepilin-type N-terminal cleavage/methylation domain-containing protein/prepilin-type processing-associated H-X9-DG protein
MQKSNIVRKRTGFTLIELLVVIAIIAILAAILFPVFARARENARRASCQSNLKQIGLGLMQYSQDYDEKLVPMWNYTGGAGTPPLIWWQDLVQPYVKSTQLFICPSHATRFPYSYGRGNSVAGGPLPDPMDWSYVLNNVTNPPLDTGQGYIFPVHNGPTVYPGKALAAIEDVATTIAVFDGGQYNVLEITVWDRTDLGATAAGACGAVGCVAKRHLDGANFLFFDGHVKFLGRTQPNMWTVKSD